MAAVRACVSIFTCVCRPALYMHYMCTHIYVYMHIYEHLYLHLRVCADLRPCTGVHALRALRACVHVHAIVRARVRSCARACVRACGRKCMCAWVRAFLPALQEQTKGAGYSIDIVMASIVMACIVMAYIVMAHALALIYRAGEDEDEGRRVPDRYSCGLHSYGLYGHGLYSYGPCPCTYLYIGQEKTKGAGYSMQNISFGMGGGLLHRVHRDSMYRHISYGNILVMAACSIEFIATRCTALCVDMCLQ